MNVLIVEDEIKVVAFLKKGLEEENWSVSTAYDGLQALDMVQKQDFDVLVLDIMMPHLDGLGFLKKIRERGNLVPVLILTAKDSIPDRIKGLKQGADDYLIKPFAFEELLARLYALIRRNKWEQPEIITIGDMTINIEKHTVHRDGRGIELSRMEYRLLEFLARNCGRALSREHIEDYIWGRHSAPDTNTVDVYINFLRKKIDKPFKDQLIHTVRGIGYKLEAEDVD